MEETTVSTPRREELSREEEEEQQQQQQEQQQQRQVPPTEEDEANKDRKTSGEGNNEIVAQDTSETETEDGNEDDDENSNATIVQDSNEGNNDRDSVSLAEGNDNDDDEGTKKVPTIQEEAPARQTAIETENATDDLRPIPSSLVDQDLAVFGRLNAQLADAFAERIEAAIARGVDSLPLLDDHCYRGSSESQNNNNDNNNNNSAATTGGDSDSKSPKERLIETLRYKFVRNVDVLEAYCAHHVLTLRKHPPARRKRIVAVLRDGPTALDPPLDAPSDAMDENGSDDNGKASPREHHQPPAYPGSPSAIPTPGERENLSRNLDRLRAEIAAARNRRNELEAELASIRRAGDAVAAVAETLRESSETVERVRSRVGGLVESSRVLDQLRDDAGRLMGKLETIKRERDPSERENPGDGENNNDDPLDLLAAGRTIAKRPKSLAPAMEAYQKDRRALGLLSDSTNDADGTSGQRGLELLRSVRRMVTASESEQEGGS